MPASASAYGDQKLGPRPHATGVFVSLPSHLHMFSRFVAVLELTFSMAPDALLSHLHRADGSATYSQNGYTIIGAVNGPIEVLRKDELPSEATVEVNIRPAVGVGSTEYHAYV
jgi:hypothetical protein